MALNGPAWLPLALVLGALSAVAYADRLVVSISLVYLYILPLAVGAIFLRKKVSYSLIVVCVLFHDYYSPRNINPGLRIFHNLSAMLCFAFLVYVIQRYMEQREALAKTVQRQRDDLLKDVELAVQVQRLFLPQGKPVIAGLEMAGMIQPARGVSGDYYDYIPIDAHTIQIIIADVAGKGVPAALLMSATAAAMRFEANHDRNMLAQVKRLNTGILSVSDDERYVTLLLAEIDTRKRIIQYVNCGHNPALLFRASTGTLTRLNSSCPPIGLSPEETCELTSADLMAGDVAVFYTDGVTEAENRLGEEFGLERLSAVVRRGSLLSAEELKIEIFKSAANFCGELGFQDDVTILVVKCHLDGSPGVSV
ncbi:MAG TPA: PP2C family protein-serine/threonine phosphatase [Candidatus Polarisedimenticolia bacterium]|nr:PP2C family protein-serine/threonine phosphatase [Candidatus Polarisedimenticolia bacterium]